MQKYKGKTPLGDRKYRSCLLFHGVWGFDSGFGTESGATKERINVDSKKSMN